MPPNLIRTIIVENEKPQIDHLLTKLKEYFHEIEVIATCSTTSESIEKIRSLHPALVFLDVELESKYSGFEVLELTRDEDYKVIFTTAYSEHAKKAFRFSTIDFIEKPFGIDDLREAIERFKTSLPSHIKEEKIAFSDNNKESNPKLRKLGLPMMGEKRFVPVQEIIMCQADKGYCDIFLTGSRRMTISKNLKWVEERLLDYGFYRVHDAYLVNMLHIEKFKGKGEGGTLELIEGHEADVAKRKKEGFLKKMEEAGYS